METQRCIWRCLSEHGHGRKYEACVARLCNGEPQAKQNMSKRPKAVNKRPAKRVIRNNRGDVLIRKLN